MKKKQGKQTRPAHSGAARLMAVVIALTLALTTSGFASLAEEIGDGNTGAAAVPIEAAEAQAAAEEAARIAAEQAAAEEAARIAAEQAAAEEAARIEAEQAAAEEAARIEAEQAAAEEAARIEAEQAAAEEAARIAAEQAAAEEAARAEAEQAAAEEAARIAAEEAEQAAAEEAARIAAEEAEQETAEAQTEDAAEIQTETVSDEWAENAAEAAEEDSAEESEAEEITYAVEVDDISVEVEVPAGALPNGAVLNLQHFAEESIERKNALDLLYPDAEEDEKKEANLEMLDAFFSINGERVEPAEAVLVKISMADTLAKDGNADRNTLEAWHFVNSEDGMPLSVLTADIGERSEGSVDTEKNEVKFYTESMGRFGITWEDTPEEETEAGFEETEIEYAAGTFVYEGEDYTVTLIFEADALIPLNAKMDVYEYDRDSEVYQAYCAAEELMGSDEDHAFRLFHIALSEAEEEVNESGFDEEAAQATDTETENGIVPAADVQIIISYLGAEKSTEYTVAWFDQETAVETETESVWADGTEEISFAAETLGDFAVTPVITEEYLEGTLTYEGEDYVVSVTVDQDAKIPVDAELIAPEYEKDSEIYQQRLEEAAKYYEWDLETDGDTDRDRTDESAGTSHAPEPEQIRLFNIGLFVTDEEEITEIEPAAAVEIEITYLEQEEENEFSITHFSEDIEELESTSTYDEDGNLSVRFDTQAFSDYMLLANTGHYVVFNLNNDNNLSSGGSDFRGYTGAGRASVALGSTASGAVTINLPSDSDLGGNFTVYQPNGGNPVTVHLDSIDNYYNYRLEGWYNICTGEYYSVKNGSVQVQIDVSDENVFYADYFADSYNFGGGAGTVSTKDLDFVDIQLFDYNELFNLYSASVVQDDTENERWTDSGRLYSEPVTGSGSRGTWLNNSFLFKSNAVEYDNYMLNGSLLHLADLETRNEFEEYKLENAKEDWGISSADYRGNTLLNLLFNPDSSALGVKYVGSANNLFQYGNANSGMNGEFDGYYYYSSNLNAASYNQSEGKFYVYDQKITYDSHNMFLPFNNYISQPVKDTDSGDPDGINYFFGMSMQVDFYVPNAVDGENVSAEGVGNVDTKNHDMVFNFSGDDDIIIFVDNDLILDMSGIHFETDGYINFNTGKWSALLDASDFNWKGDPVSGTPVNGTFSLSSGEHTLTVYYLERGSGYSNLTVSFNVVPAWKYYTGDVKTIQAEKEWKDEHGQSITETSELNPVQVGLFDILEEGTDDTFGYAKNGNSYTVTYTDDSGVQHTFVYDADTPSLIYAKGSEGAVKYTETDSEGRVVDDDGYVIAWLEENLLHIRIDVQELGNENSWRYVWEMLDPAGNYEVLELGENAGYVTATRKEDLTSYEYWTIIGDNEIEEDFENKDSTLKIILTDAAQQTTETLGGTKEAYGWVLTAGEDGRIFAKQIKFSQYATLTAISDEDDADSYIGTYGVTSQREVEELGDGAVWYVEDAGDREGSDGVEDFYLFCMLNGQKYYMTVSGNELTLTANPDNKGKFYYNLLGELRIVREEENTYTRVVIDENGNVSLDAADLTARTNDVRIYTFTDTATGGFTFTATNILAGHQKSVEIGDTEDGDVDDFADDGKIVKAGDKLTYKIDYVNYAGEGAEITITDILDKKVTYVENSATLNGVPLPEYDSEAAAEASMPYVLVSTNEEERTILTYKFIAAGEAVDGGNITFQVIVNNDVDHETIENQGSVKINNDKSIDTNKVENPVPEDPVKGVDTNDDQQYDDDGASVHVGQTLEYEISYHNTSSEAVSVIFTDTLTDELDFISADHEGTYNEENRTITWPAIEAAAGETVRVNFKATVNEKAYNVDSVENTARMIYSDYPDITVNTNTVENPVPETPVPEDPEKGVDTNADGVYDNDGASVYVGQTLEYEISYHNTSSEAVSVIFTDTLTDELDYMDASDNGAYDEASRTITWPAIEVGSEETVSVTFKVTVNEKAWNVDTVKNTASMAYADYPDVTINTNTVENPVPEDPVKGVDTKEDGVYDNDGEVVYVGQTLEYEISYYNPDSEAVSVIFTDILTEELDFVGADHEGIYNDETRTITWPLIEVAAGETVKVTFTATVNEKAWDVDAVENTASMIYTDYPDVTVNTNTVENPVPEDPVKGVDTNDDQLYKDDGTSVYVGQTLEYEISYYNPDSEAVSVLFTDILADELDFVSADHEGTYNDETRTITWPAIEVGSEETVRITFKAIVNEKAYNVDTVKNTASMVYGDYPDVIINTNTVENPVPEVPVPEDPVKGVDTNEDGVYDNDGEVVYVGQILDYEISYYNPDNEPVSVIFTDILTEELDFESADHNGTYNEENRTITWPAIEVGSEGTVSVTFKATVNEKAWEVDTVENTASMTYSDHPDVTVNTNTVENPVPEDPVKGVDTNDDQLYKDDGASVYVGQTLEYEISYYNPDSEAVSIIFTDTLADELNFVSADHNGTYNEENRTITWPEIEVGSEETVSVTFKAMVNEKAYNVDTVKNTANMVYSEYPDVIINTNTVENPVPEIPIPEDPVKGVDTNEDGVYDNDGEVVYVGQTLDYEISYYNPDNEPVSVIFTDILTEELDFESADHNGTYNEENRTITWPTIEVGSEGTVSVTFKATVNEKAWEVDAVENTASMTYSDHPDVVVNTNTVENPVPEDPVKGIDTNEDGVYDNDGEVVYVGQTLEYEISYYNPDSEAVSVIFTDILTEELDYVGADHNGIYNKENRTITWPAIEVGSEETVSVTFTATVNEKALDVDTVENIASMTYSDYPDVVVNTNMVENPVPEDPVKGVDTNNDGVYDNNSEIVYVGQILDYEISYYNQSGETVSVIFTDTLTEELDFESADHEGRYNEEDRTITWPVIEVPAGETVSVTFKATVNEKALDIDTVENTAGMIYRDYPDVTVNTNTVENPVPEDPEKGVDTNNDSAYDNNGEVVYVGQTLEYEISYYNPDSEAVSVIFTDILSDELDFVTASSGGMYDNATHTITWPAIEVGSEETVKVTFKATVNEKAWDVDAVENTASMAYSDYPDVTVNTNTVENPVPEDPVKGVDTNNDGAYDNNGEVVYVGQTLEYEISYYNPDSEAVSVIFTDILTEELDYVGADHDGIYNDETRTITWPSIEVAAGETVKVTFKATVNEKALDIDTVENTAGMIYSDYPDVTVNTNTVENPVPEDPVKGIDTNADGVYDNNGEIVYVGQALEYEISYYNPDSEMVSVIFTDTLADELDYMNASDGGEYDEDTRTIIWPAIKAEAGETVRVTFKATVNEKAWNVDAVENTASMIYSDHPDVVVNTNTVENPVPEDPVKGVDTNNDQLYDNDGYTVYVGQTLEYEISYYNPDSEAVSIIFTDTLTEELDFVSADHEGRYNEEDRTITWPAIEVPAGETVSVTFKATVNEKAWDVDAIENTASMAYSNYPDVVVNTNTVENPVPEDPEKGVDTNNDGAYDNNGEVVYIGQTLEYEISYYNPDSEAVSIIFTDTLTEELDFVSADHEGTYNEENRTITWAAIEAEAGETVRVTFKATVNEKALDIDTVENTASMAYSDYPDVIVNTNTVENPVPEDPEKGVDTNNDGAYDNNGEVVYVGQTLEYEISYYNPDSEAVSVIFTDTLADELNFVSADHEGTYNKEDRTITWPAIEAETGETVRVTFKATVNEKALDVDTIENTAGLIYSDYPDVTVNTNTVENPVPEDPVKGVDTNNDGVYDNSSEIVYVGQVLEYEISYYNPDSEMVSVIFTDTLADELDYMNASDGGEYDEDTRTIIWPAIKAEAGETVRVTFKVTVNEKAWNVDAIENTAGMTYRDYPDVTVNTNTVENPVPEDPVKGVDTNNDGAYDNNGEVVYVGQTLEYEISYHNTSSEAVSVIFTDTLTDELDFISAGHGGTYNEENRTITWPAIEVPAGETVSVTFTATVNEKALDVDTVENTAGMTYSDYPDVIVNTNTVENPVPEDPVKGVDTKEDGVYDNDGEVVYVGQTLEYEISYYNPDSEAVSVIFTDILTEELDYVGSDHDGIYNDETRTITWPAIEVGSEGTVSVTFKATVNEKALDVDTIENTASMTYRDYSDVTVNTNTVENPVPEDPVKGVDTNNDGVYDNSSEIVYVGQILEYEISYYNPDGEAVSVIFTDILSDELNYVSASDGGVYDEDTRMITWPEIKAEAGETVRVTFNATVNEKAWNVDAIENTAGMTYRDYPDVIVNTNTVENPVPEDPVKGVDTNNDSVYDNNSEIVYVGQTLEYEISYYNPDSEAVSVLFTDTLAGELDYMNASDGGVYDEDTRTITWPAIEVGSEETVRVTFKAVVNKKALSVDTIKNTAEMTYRDYPDVTVNTNTVENPTPNMDFYPLDEEIATNPDDMLNPDTYVKSESVSEWNMIEIEISTNLPRISAEALGLNTFSYTMLFHDQLSLELVLDEDTADFSVYIAGIKIDPYYYTVKLTEEEGITDGCNFELEVNLSALYADGLLDACIDEDGYLQDELIQIFFWTDLENADFGEENYYTSTTWYEVYQESVNEGGETSKELLYQSNVDVVYIYTYEISLLKYDAYALTGEDYADAALEGAVFGLFYDEECTDAIQRYYDPVDHMHGTDTEAEAADYIVTSDENGEVRFVGLSEGTYYVKELQAPDGYYILDETPLEIRLTNESGGRIYTGLVANMPEPDTPHTPKKDVDSDGDGEYGDSGRTVSTGDELTYKITYYNHHNEPADVTITDELDSGVEFVSASDGGTEKDGVVTWTIQDVPAYTEGSVTFAVKVTEAAALAGEVVNTALVQIGDDPAVNTNTVENPLPDEEPTEPVKSVDIGDGTETDVGKELVYTISYYNNHHTAEEVKISDALDGNVEFVSASDDGVYDPEKHAVTWTVSEAAPFTGGSVTVTVRVLSGAVEAGEVENTAAVQIGNDESMTTNTVKNPVKKPQTEGPQTDGHPTEEPPTEEPQTNPETPQTEAPEKTPETSGGTSVPGSGTSGSGTSGGGTYGTGGTPGTGSAASTVKTADETPLGFYLMLLLMALAVLAGGCIYRRRRRAEEK